MSLQARTGAKAKVFTKTSMVQPLLKIRACLDFPGTFLFIRANQLAVSRLQATDRDPIRYKMIPEVNTRQCVAPSGAFWLCPFLGVLFLTAKGTTFRKTRNKLGISDV